jgi:orotidine-5'-phosphate decarboxylase
MQGRALDKPSRRGLADSARFLKTLVAAPRLTGAVAPSGRALARAMAAATGSPSRGLIVELGPGTGPVTQSLIEARVSSERLVLVEYDPGFCRMLERRFGGVRVIQGDAYDLPHTLAPFAGQAIAAVVSSLPLLNQPPRRREKVIGDAFALMGPAGVFVQFTYICRRPLSGLIGSTGRTLMPSKVAELSRLAPRDRLIVALDVPDVGEALRLVERIGDSAVFYKVGMELAYGGGLPLVSELAAAGKQVFLDLKLHDIPNTVERATSQAARLGARFLTVHAYPQTMRAAVAGAKGSGMQILGVTVLTSYDDADLFDAVYRFGVVETVRRRAEQALELSVDGLVASPAEAAMARQTVGARLLLVTPGIRPAGGTVGDQKRVATPAEAIRNGADYLVVGRPVTQSPDPRVAAEAIVAEIGEAH